MNKVACLLAVLLLAGCQNHKRETVQPVSPDLSKLNPEQSTYVHGVTAILQSALASGDSCRFSISQGANGLLDDVNLESGDSGACSPAIRASVDAANSKAFPSKPTGLPYKLLFVLGANKSLGA